MDQHKKSKSMTQDLRFAVVYCSFENGIFSEGQLHASLYLWDGAHGRTGHWRANTMGPRHFTSTCCQWETDTAVHRDGGIVETAKYCFLCRDCRDGCRDCWFLCRDCRDGKVKEGHLDDSNSLTVPTVPTQKPTVPTTVPTVPTRFRPFSLKSVGCPNLEWSQMVRGILPLSDSDWGESL